MGQEKIIKAEIKKANRHDPQCTDMVVHAVFDDGRSRTLFHFYADEIEIKTEELIGLKEDEARQLKRNKDTAYLQS